MDRIRTLEEWLATHPEDRFAAYALALELDKAGRRDEAVAAMRELVERHPESGAGHLQLGRILAELGRPEDARAAWEAGLAALAGSADPDARRAVREIQGALDGLDE